MVLADISAEQLEAASASLASDAVETVVLDVTDAAGNEACAAALWGAHKDVAFVFLNAGITYAKSGWSAAWETDVEDFERVLDIDLMGVVHGLKAWMPRLLARPADSAPTSIVSTASIAGLVNCSNVTNISYQIAKHGVVLLMESVHASLRDEAQKGHDTNIQAHVLCPSGTATNIFQATLDTAKGEKDNADAEKLRKGGSVIAIPPELLIDRLVEGIDRDIFYIVSSRM